MFLAWSYLGLFLVAGGVALYEIVKVLMRNSQGVWTLMSEELPEVFFLLFF